MLKHDNSGFNNKVDIWAMGCILFELATGANPFATDHVVAEYSRGDWKLEEHCHPNIGTEVAKAISEAIRGMFQIRPSLRPRSTALAVSFDKHYQSAKEYTQVQLLEKSQGSASLGMLTSSTDPNGAKTLWNQLMFLGLVALFVNKNNFDSISFLSTATGDSENVSVFQTVLPSLSLRQDSRSRSGKHLDWGTTVLYGLANAPSSRVLTVSAPPYGARRLIELWEAVSGSLLWEKEMEVKHLRKSCQPSFSEDSNYLVVYDGNWVEIVNAHSAQRTGIIAAKDCQPVALAVGNNGTCLAIANDELENMGFGPGALFKKSFLNEEQSPIDLVSTSGFRDVQICYASDSDRLIMAGHFTETYAARVVVIFWDVKSCSTLSPIVCGERGSSIDGPIFPIRLTESYGRVENYGVVLRLDDR
jgi:hypothetical protein